MGEEGTIPLAYVYVDAAGNAVGPVGPGPKFEAKQEAALGKGRPGSGTSVWRVRHLNEKGELDSESRAMKVMKACNYAGQKDCVTRRA